MTKNKTITALINKLAKIYPASEAESIAKLVFEKNGDDPEKLDEAAERLIANEPVQYVLNESWFYNLSFYVNRNVLIPRPETEELVDWVIKSNKQSSPSIIDVGTGSGCIAIILKRMIPGSRVWACDKSIDALKVAERNAEVHQTKIHFAEIDFLDKNQTNGLGVFDIIVSNPPYIPESESSKLDANVRDFEPYTALFVPDNNPLVFYEHLANFAIDHMSENGKLFAELHADYAGKVKELFDKKGIPTTIKKDMQGKERMLSTI